MTGITTWPNSLNIFELKFQVSMKLFTIQVLRFHRYDLYLVWSTTPDSYMQRSWASSDLQNVGSGALVLDPVSLFDYVDQLHALGIVYLPSPLTDQENT